MRTTVDLPKDLHELARQLAHDSNRSMSEVISSLMRNGLSQGSQVATGVSKRGMPVVAVGRTITIEDVRSLEDEM